MLVADFFRIKVMINLLYEQQRQDENDASSMKMCIALDCYHFLIAGKGS